MTIPKCLAMSSVKIIMMAAATKKDMIILLNAAKYQ